MKNLIAILAVVTIIFSAAGISLPVDAADIAGKGSLTIEAEYGEKALQGMRVEIFRIANAVSDGSKIKYVSNSNFASKLTAKDLDPDSMSAEDNAKLAATLKAYVLEKTIGGTILATDSKGQVLFSDLAAGLYLVMQNTAANSGTNANNSSYNLMSFIVPVPYNDGGGLNYNVTASAKLEEAKKTGTVTVNLKFSTPSDIPTDSTSFTVVLQQNGQTKYTFTLNKANNWTLSKADIMEGTYDVLQVNIPSGYQCVSLTPATITVTRGGTIVVTVMNKKIPVTTTTAAPTTTARVTTTAAPTTTITTTRQVTSTTKAPATSDDGPAGGYNYPTTSRNSPFQPDDHDSPSAPYDLGNLQIMTDAIDIIAKDTNQNNAATSAPVRTNPKTGDSPLVILLGLAVCGGILAVAKKSKFFKR